MTLEKSIEVIIQTPANDLQASLDFYTRLGFTKLTSSQHLVSDGKVVIEINPAAIARAAIKLYGSAWHEKIGLLETHAPVVEIDEGYLLCDPAGVWVYLIESTETLPDPSVLKTAILGNYVGISIETLAIDKSLKFWKVLGFTVSMGGADQGWVSLTNGGVSISLMKQFMCPHLFFNPSLTYFNGGKNLPVIENIRRAGVPITQEITQFNPEGIVDNVIIRDPGGLGFFIFND